MNFKGPTTTYKYPADWEGHALLAQAVMFSTTRGPAEIAYQIADGRCHEDSYRNVTYSSVILDRNVLVHCFGEAGVQHFEALMQEGRQETHPWAGRWYPAGFGAVGRIMAAVDLLISGQERASIQCFDSKDADVTREWAVKWLEERNAWDSAVHPEFIERLDFATQV